MSSRSSTPTSTTSKYTKIPPIITNEVDRRFLQDLSEYIDYEMSRINTEEDEQRYIIFKTVFNRIIEHVKAYKPLLTAVKKEYEDTIEVIKSGQREAIFLHGKLKAMASEPSTMRNYKKRGDELEERIGVIERDNDRLQKQLLNLKAKRKEQEEFERQVTEPPKREFKKDHRLIPGLTLEESTNVPLLYRDLEKLDRQLKELDISLRTRYVEKSYKVELKEKLDNKVLYRDQLALQGQLYRAKQHRLKIAVEAAQAYNRVKPPHQTVGDAVFFALSHAAGLQIQEKVKRTVQRLTRFKRSANELAPDQNQGEAREGSAAAASKSSFDDDDPNREKEAEMMLEYIEKFNELFEDGKYEEAAIHAANSPKGILRTSATLAKFRDVKVQVNGRSPLLAFSEAVMSSVGAIGMKPNDTLSLECVECALYENRLDLLSHWISQERLTLSQDLGDRISAHCKCNVPCRCGSQALAQNVFSKLQLHRQTVVCLLKQGRIHAGMDYAKHKMPFTRDQFMSVLRTCPSVQLMHALVEEDGEGSRALPIGVVLLVVLEKNQYNLVLPFIQDQQKQPSVDDPQINQFQAAVLDDSYTTSVQWDSLVELFQDQGYEDTAMCLLASITVLNAMRSALYTRLGVNTPQSPQTDSPQTDPTQGVPLPQGTPSLVISQPEVEPSKQESSSKEIQPEAALPQKELSQKDLTEGDTAITDPTQS
ncbi:clathrin heavy chain linker domain-containing protein 1-like isoform X2 [Mizuhopecten yessoensis]|uniref:clathrin heavy chain linker domain-containing protein 1-like isoform X2 n=1 Tax=Mizuhopecten yessoensis TaxID=6573 RepID=UPI000B457C5B|nr:clathrin heavy chain linker domain-containing protein 1-like isoform X2 [Mizuhopecten yessoensis]